MITGSCLCGKITYEISGGMGDIVHCHCQTCRKAHGAAFSSVASVEDQHFRLSGADQLSFFESSPGKTRYFCKHCGTQVYAKRENTEHIILRLGSLDSNPEVQARSHIWLSQKADWYDPAERLPGYDEFE